jgi:hypothetical protein
MIKWRPRVRSKGYNTTTTNYQVLLLLHKYQTCQANRPSINSQQQANNQPTEQAADRCTTPARSRRPPPSAPLAPPALRRPIGAIEPSHGDVGMPPLQPTTTDKRRARRPPGGASHSLASVRPSVRPTDPNIMIRRPPSSSILDSTCRSSGGSGNDRVGSTELIEIVRVRPV